METASDVSFYCTEIIIGIVDDSEIDLFIWLDQSENSPWMVSYGDVQGDGSVVSYNGRMKTLFVSLITMTNEMADRKYYKFTLKFDKTQLLLYFL